MTWFCPDSCCSYFINLAPKVICIDFSNVKKPLHIWSLSCQSKDTLHGTNTVLLTSSIKAASVIKKKRGKECIPKTWRQLRNGLKTEGATQYFKCAHNYCYVLSSVRGLRYSQDDWWTWMAKWLWEIQYSFSIVLVSITRPKSIDLKWWVFHFFFILWLHLHFRHLANALIQVD